MTKQALILSFRSLENDPRVLRQVDILHSLGYSVQTLGPSDTAIPGIHCLDSGPLSQYNRFIKFLKLCYLVIRNYQGFYWITPHIKKSWALLEKQQPDLIIANEYDTWPLAIRAKEKLNCKVIFDAHEYYPLLFEDKPVWKLLVKPYFTYLCKQFLAQADACLTVNQSIADKYEQDFASPFQVVMNVPKYQEISASPVDPVCIRLVHHGVSMHNRRLERMIELFELLDQRFELYFLLMPNEPDYLDFLKQRATGNSRIHFPKPVPTDQIPVFISQFDIGLFWLEPVNFNYRVALPNKLFEFIQARLAVAVSPAVEMERVINTYQCGVVAENWDLQAFAQRLNQLNQKEIEAFKKASDQAAKHLNAEISQQVYEKIIHNFSQSV